MVSPTKSSTIPCRSFHLSLVCNLTCVPIVYFMISICPMLTVLHAKIPFICPNYTAAGKDKSIIVWFQLSPAKGWMPYNVWSVNNVAVQELLKNEDQPESCTRILAGISCFHRSTRALTQAEPHLAVAPEQLSNSRHFTNCAWKALIPS